MVVDIGFEQIDLRQRRGEAVFNPERIEQAILGAANECGGFQRYVLPEEILGRNFQLDFRGRTDQEIAHSITDKVIFKANERMSLDVYDTPKHPNPFNNVHINDIQNYVVHALWDFGFADIAKSYLAYMSAHSHLRLGNISVEQVPFWGFPNREFKERKEQMYDKLGCRSVEEVNEMIEKGTFMDLLMYFCDNYDGQLDDAYETLMESIDDVRMIVIAGKSSSGKTTSTHKFLYERETGKTLVPLHVDNYFKTLQPRDSRGDTNYELPEALDLSLLAKDLKDMLEGKVVVTPKYDFGTAVRYDKAGQKIHLKDKDHILVLDSHNGLYHAIQDAAKAVVGPKGVFNMYLGQWNPQTAGGEPVPHYFNNFLFRIGRDVWNRSTDFMFNIPHIRTISAGEETHITPRMNAADVIIDSGTPVFYHVMKHHFQTYQLPDPRVFLDKGQTFAAERCYRFHQLLNYVTAITDKMKAQIPDTAVMREAIGGSRY